jgi:NAD(P)H-hydrate epimerase
MTEVIETFDELQRIAQNKDVLAIGPGLGTYPETAALVRRAVDRLPQRMVIDADALNAVAGSTWTGKGKVRVLTPHPGEMSRLSGKKTADILADRVGVVRAFATELQVTLVLKGERSLIGFGDGRVWINPTGTPAIATGGSGDILTGLIAGFLGQFPGEPDLAVAAALYLHGLSGELAAAELGEKPVIATDLLRYLPKALEACARISDGL